MFHLSDTSKSSLENYLAVHVHRARSIFCSITLSATTDSLYSTMVNGDDLWNVIWGIGNYGSDTTTDDSQNVTTGMLTHIRNMHSKLQTAPSRIRRKKQMSRNNEMLTCGYEGRHRDMDQLKGHRSKVQHTECWGPFWLHQNEFYMESQN